MKTIKLNLKGILGIITLCMASLLVGVAYADENPMMPGFTGILATLGLLGAALSRRE